MSGLETLMSTTGISSSLSVVVPHSPGASASLHRIVRSTASLVGQVLAALDYRGEWSISFVRHIRKKANEKFRVLRYHQNGVLARTKPGDNGSCWEIVICPPQPYKIHDVYKKMLGFNYNRMRPNARILEASPAVADLIAAGQGPIPLASTPEKIVPPVIEKPEKINSPIIETPPPKKAPPIEAPTATEFLLNILSKGPMFKKDIERLGDQAGFAIKTLESVKLQIGALHRRQGFGPGSMFEWYLPTKDTGAEMLPKQTSESPLGKDFTLKIDSSAVDSLCNDAAVLNHGLMALAIKANDDGSIFRQVAVAALVDYLELKSFIIEHPVYNDPIKAATIILKGLKKHGFISLWNCAPRGSSRVRATTKGYIIAPPGRQQLLELSKHLKLNINDHLLNIKATEEVKPVVAAPAPAPSQPTTNASQSTNGDIREKVRKNLGLFEGLLSNHENLSGAVSDCSKEIESIEIALKEKTDRILKLTRQLDELQRQLDEEAEAQHRLVKDLEGYKDIKKEEEDKLSDIENRLKQILAGNIT